MSASFPKIIPSAINIGMSQHIHFSMSLGCISSSVTTLRVTEYDVANATSSPCILFDKEGLRFGNGMENGSLLMHS